MRHHLLSAVAVVDSQEWVRLALCPATGRSPGQHRVISSSHADEARFRPQFCTARPNEARSPSADDSVLIEGAGYGADVEQVPLPHPALRPIEHFTGVGLGDDALPRPE